MLNLLEAGIYTASGIRTPDHFYVWNELSISNYSGFKKIYAKKLTIFLISWMSLTRKLTIKTGVSLLKQRNKVENWLEIWVFIDLN